MIKKAKSKTFYKPEIDGIKALAILGIVLNHANKSFVPNGYLGVDIFFVISGYLITASLKRIKKKNLSAFFIDFYLKRIRRIFSPLLVFIIISSTFISLFEVDKSLYDLSLRTGISSLFGLSNLYLIRQSTDYFSEVTELNIFAHTWSLGIEIQFYIICPFLILISNYIENKTKNKNIFYLIVPNLIKFMVKNKIITN